MKTTDSNMGFTLIENIVVMVLLAVMIAGSLSLYPAVMKFFVRQERRIVAGNLAYAQIEDLRQIAHNDFADPLLAEVTGHSETDHINMPGTFTLRYDVSTTLNWGGAGGDYKKVTVRCAYPAPETVTLEGIVTQ